MTTRIHCKMENLQSFRFALLFKLTVSWLEMTHFIVFSWFYCLYTLTLSNKNLINSLLASALELLMPLSPLRSSVYEFLKEIREVVKIA